MKPRTLALLAGALALAACSDGGLAPLSAPTEAPLHAARGPVVEGSYIVVLRPGADPRAVAAVAGASPRHVYTSALTGFAATLNDGQVRALRHHPAVDFVEPDQRGGVSQAALPWGLDRIDQRNLPLDNVFGVTSTGAGIRAYIIDSGLQANHPQFGARASNVYDYAGGSGADCHGHGTHVGGIVGGVGYGVAKGIYLRGVRVTDCAGGSSTAIVIAAVDWVRLNHIKPAVANMSLGFPYSSALNLAVANLTNAGVFTAVAAGNESQLACNVSPASASGTLTVAASDRYDNHASFSNHGGCVDVYAPGVSIPSAWIGSATRTLSGTSMAAPHAAGVGALYKATVGDVSSPSVVGWIIGNATTGVIAGVPANTPNRLLYKSTL